MAEWNVVLPNGGHHLHIADEEPKEGEPIPLPGGGEVVIDYVLEGADGSPVFMARASNDSVS